MTDLTEQWEKGELPEGYYYVKDGDNMIAEYLDGYFYNNGEPMTSFSGGVDEVLEPVPSYQELQEERENNEFLLKSRESEIIKLKNLLKECQKSIHWYQETYGAMDLDTYTLLAKLNEVLK
ncbi:MAG: hypothetical protein J6S67_21690 [Methanobrevibacter sp.]|nr:hypothetical protein [Methanobrevibacter sp.]